MRFLYIPIIAFACSCTTEAQKTPEISLVQETVDSARVQDDQSLKDYQAYREKRDAETPDERMEEDFPLHCRKSLVDIILGKPVKKDVADPFGGQKFYYDNNVQASFDKDNFCDGRNGDFKYMKAAYLKYKKYLKDTNQ